MARITMSPEELRKLVEEMTEARAAMNVHRDRLGELRREARSGGLNMQAINSLIDIMGENSHDRGKKALADLVSYARAAGVDPDLGSAPARPAEAGRLAQDGEGEIVMLAPPKASVVGESAAKNRPWLGAWAKGLWQGSLALGVSAALLWLLH
ncbi:MAG: hypothetical protein MI785_17070 [Kiloniellales bacterium]|nr:hypothetical protein [Kiloniellales bacterium]